MFINLHTHSNYSFLNGAIKIEELVKYAKDFNMPAIALTDTNGMYGLIDFAKLAHDEGIKPILGTYVDDPQNPELNTILLARNREGYSTLCKVITQRQLNENFSLLQVISDYLLSNRKSLFVITSSLELLRMLKSKLGQLHYDDLFIEIFAVKKSEPRFQKIKRKAKELFDFAQENQIPIVASNPVYFPKKDDFILHKVLVAIKFNTTLSHIDYLINQNLNNEIYQEKSHHLDQRKSKNKFSALNDIGQKILQTIATEENYFKSSDEMMNLWKALPEAIENTRRIADACNVDLELGKYKHPKFPLPKGETSFSYLWKIAFRGLEEKYKPITQQAINRLQEELNVIEQLGFADYFLIVWDIAQQAKRMNMMMLGRGSAANSIVAYCLGLTQIDPLKHNLYFERFLNLGRASPPDIDLDFSWKERDAIVKYVFEKYGEDRVAMISTTVTFRARSAFREVAKVFGLSNTEISEYSQFIPWTSAENLPVLSEKFPEAKKLKFEIEPLKTIVNLAQKLAGFPHHLSIHPGGIVISPEPITNFTALEYAENKGLGLIITQPDMYPIEDLGLVKIDLLSQRSLAVVKDTMRKITEN